MGNLKLWTDSTEKLFQVIVINYLVQVYTGRSRFLKYRITPAEIPFDVIAKFMKCLTCLALSFR